MRVTEVRKAGSSDRCRPKTKIYDAKANPITVMYDMLGRKTELTTKDGGAKRYTYDELHLLYEDDEVMRQSGSRIDYSYDGFNRVVKIAYPEGGDVEYEYGIPKAANNNEVGAKTNAAGKVISVRDEAGETRYEYGKLGEVVKETRTLKRHIPAYESEKSAVMEYVSDYLGRMQSITYPDREVVTYGYDAGGQVCSITSERDGKPYTYVADIRYDEYGQRVYIKYGNGVETNYTYDENMRWLKHIGTENKYGTQYQNINYSFDDVGNVLGYKNDCMNGARYSTEQTYTYDALYQLISATGTTEDNPYAIPDSPDYTSTYNQDFSFDAIGNMTYKKSKETITPAKRKSGGDDLNYDLTYEYDANYAHRLTRAGSDQKGWRYYTYDANGNVTSESDGVAPNEDTTTLTPVTVTTHTNEAGESVYEADYAWAWPWSDSDTGSGKVSPNNKRIYEWNSRNLLMRSVALGYDTRYAYSADGNRAAKWTTGNLSETLYFNTMWTWHIEKGLSQEQQGQYSKHIYLGETRLVTKQTSDLEEHYGQSEELRHQYYYHPDHLGSAQLVTDYEGNEYQRIEYTPYGELWVEKKTAHEKDMRYLPYKFTAKEQDEETGLYYYGARYLDAKYSRWMSADPAVSDYIPMAPVDDEAKKHNQQLPGQGGVFNVVNFQLYHYAGNNPVKYIDPDGREDDTVVDTIKLGIKLATKLAPLFEKPNPDKPMSEADAIINANDIQRIFTDITKLAKEDTETFVSTLMMVGFGTAVALDTGLIDALIDFNNNLKEKGFDIPGMRISGSSNFSIGAIFNYTIKFIPISEGSFKLNTNLNGNLNLTIGNASSLSITTSANFTVPSNVIPNLQFTFSYKTRF